MKMANEPEEGELMMLKKKYKRSFWNSLCTNRGKNCRNQEGGKSYGRDKEKLLTFFFFSLDMFFFFPNIYKM
jgi:hypothetical protein